MKYEEQNITTNLKHDYNSLIQYLYPSCMKKSGNHDFECQRSAWDHFLSNIAVLNKVESEISEPRFKSWFPHLLYVFGYVT